MLEWNVYYEDFNRKKIGVINIFTHSGFTHDCSKVAKLSDVDKKYFYEMVKLQLMYYFWCKCEWEIILSGWPPCDNFNNKKVDVYDQIMINYDRFIDYLWDHRDELMEIDGGSQ